jgi:replicative DNA helicase
MDLADRAAPRRDRGGGQTRPANTGRIPPHNLQAEESVLGAILLSREALGAVIEAGLRYDDFYKPAHQHIFDVAIAVSQSGGPVDTITVADELGRLGLLDQVGGVEALHVLQNATPAISNAAHYAKIVQDAAMLRRLIMVAADISELAYNRPESVEEALDEAESRVFRVADRRVTESYLEIGELMKLAVDRIEENFARGDTITGVATGYNDLDELLSGLQPSTLNIVGARPSIGKALALDTPLATPTGWTTMGDVQTGDQLLDESGLACRVTYATPVQHGRDCFEIVFDDGSSIVADGDHRWFAYDYPTWKSLSESRREPRVVTTHQMLDEGVVRDRDGRPNWYIPLTAPLELPDGDLPIDPYVLGCWLGDGSASNVEQTIGEDTPHFLGEFAAAGYPLQRDAGLLGGARKHIPAAYLRSSVKQRLALLQGLMDADGYARPASRVVELCLSNEQLIRQAHELVCSLGHKPQSIREGCVRLPDGRRATAWTFRWSPLDPVFRLTRKLEALAPNAATSRRELTRRAVMAIRPVPSVPVRCVTVDSPRHLYLAGRTMIPTHNTAFGLGIATHVAKTTSRPVLVFSLEMGHVELTQRILSSEAEVDSTKIRNGRLTEADWAKLGRAIGRLEVPLYLDDNPRVTVMEIRAKARRLRMQYGDLALIVIDYLQLMSGGGNAENRQLEVSEISRNLKILARELEVPILALSQLSRNLETRSDKHPMLSDLRESGSLEQDADVVIFLYRDEVYNKESPDRGAADVIVAKHRAGPTGSMRLVFRGQYARFDNAAPRTMG